MLIDQADRLAPRYAHSYGASGAQSRYRIRPATTPRIGSDVREVGRCGLSLKTHQSLPPWPPRLFQFGGQPVHIRLEPRPVSLQLGLPIGQRPQFIEHGCDVARHADLIGLGMISLRLCFLQFILELCAFFNQLRLVDLDPLQFGSMVGALPGILGASGQPERLIRSRAALRLP
jgi:hypothetical protein